MSVRWLYTVRSYDTKSGGSLHFDVSEARTPEEALRVFTKHHPVLLKTDRIEVTRSRVPKDYVYGDYASDVEHELRKRHGIVLTKMSKPIQSRAIQVIREGVRREIEHGEMLPSDVIATNIATFIKEDKKMQTKGTWKDMGGYYLYKVPGVRIPVCSVWLRDRGKVDIHVTMRSRMHKSNREDITVIRRVNDDVPTAKRRALAIWRGIDRVIKEE